MKQFLIPPGWDGGPTLELSGRDFHYLIRVRRLSEGETVPAVDTSGARHTLRIRSIGESSCSLSVSAEDRGPSREDPCPPVHLLQCLPKGAKMDSIVRQAVEAGVRSIVPVVSARSIGEPSEPKLARWRRIAREAFQQSGRARLPEIGEPASLRKAAEADRGGGIGLVFHQERIGGGSLHAALCGDAETADRGVFILIGPEGGLAEEEIGMLTRTGYRPVHLGGTVLRVETAAVYAIAAVMTILRERDTWTASNRTYKESRS